MKTLITCLCILLVGSFAPLTASSTFVDYQNYNHGYCPKCNCFPCRCNAAQAEVMGAEVGVEGPPPPPPPPCATCAEPPPPEPPCDAPDAPCDAPCDAPDAPCDAPCDKPEPCDPAPVCATNCGINLCWIGLGIAVIATAGAIIVSTNNGSSANH